MLSRYKFLAIGAAFLTLAACKDEENRQETAASSSAPVVQAIKAVPHEIPLSFEYAARVQGSKETEVRARVGGILAQAQLCRRFKGQGRRRAVSDRPRTF